MHEEYAGPKRERFHKKARRTCSRCGSARNGFRPGGKSYRFDDHHDMCARCWRDVNQSICQDEHGEAQKPNQ